MVARLALLVSLVVLAGCSNPHGLPPQAEVSGTVTVRGRPLPGGTISFVSDAGVENTAPIDDRGHYRIMAAVGANKIRVDNRILKKDAAPDKAVKGVGYSPRLKAPTDAPGPVVVGAYTPIKESYASYDTSGLTYTVTEGPQAKDLDLQ